MTRGARRQLDLKIAHLAVPALGSLAIDPLTSMLDTAFIGRLGETPLAALGAALGIFNFGFFVFNFLATAIAPLVAQARARGDAEETGRVIGMGLFTALGIGVVIALALEIFAVPILHAMGARGALLEEALPYVRIRALAAPAVLVLMASFGAMRGLFDTRTPFLISLGLNLVNAALDPILIFGAGLGVAGAALATLIAQWAALLVMLLFLFRRVSQVHGVRIAPPRVSHAKLLAATGAPLAVRTAMLLSVMTGARAIATRLGDTGIASYQIAYQVWEFFALGVDALAVAAQVLVAHHLGTGRRDLARVAADRILFWALCSGGLLMVALLPARALVSEVLTTSPSVQSASTYLLLFVAFTQPLNALVFVWDGIFMGARDNVYLSVAMGIAAVAAGLVLVLVLPMGWGIGGVWWALVTLLGVRGLTLAFRYYSPQGPLRPGSNG